MSLQGGVALNDLHAGGQPSCLKLWAEWRARKGDVAELAGDDHRVLEPVG